MKKTTIDTSLLPKAYLTWQTTKYQFVLDCATGVKQTATEFRAAHPYDPRDKSSVYFNSGSKPRYAYAKYHADIERLELAEVTLDTKRTLQVHEWKYAGNKYFLGKDKSVVDENGNVCTERFNLSQYHVGYNFANFLGFYYRLQNFKAVEEFKKFLGSDTYCVGSGRTVDVCWTWHIQEWYKTSQKVKGKGKEQKLVEKLTAIPLSDATWLTEKYPVIEEKHSNYYSCYSTYIPNILYFERLTDGWSVLRMFSRNNDGTNIKEIERMYLHDDGTNRIASPSKDGWCTAKANEYWSRYQFVNKEEAMQKCNRLKYIIPLIDCSNTKVKNYLITALRFPEVEQFIRLGYKDFASGIAGSQTPKADMKNTFGYYNEKEKSLLRKVGMTKHQFDTVMKKIGDGRYNYTKRAIKTMREYFDSDFIHLDNATFDKYLTAFESLCRMSWGEPFKNLRCIEGIDRKRFIKNAVRLGESENSIYGAINDTINMYNALNVGTKPDIDWYFASRSDVVRAHDAIDALKRAQDAERRAVWDKREAERLKREEERRKKIDEDRKVYEYEDDNFIIRLPKDGNEIVREGSLQHICIGGYVSRHSTGNTNLFFLRKKNEPDMPFYAIEMNNGNSIIQIHGFGNRWLGNNPEAIPTVIRWLRKNKIHCDEKILTCASTGYGATANYVPMPVV